MPQIILKDWNLGGLSDSKYSGLPNSSYKLEGFNIHEEPGVLKVQQAIVEDRASGDAINQKIRAIVPLNDGKSYLFGENGRIWSRNSSAVYTEEVNDVNPDDGDSTLLDAAEFGDYIYYTMPERLGRWEIGTAWGTRDDNFSVLDFDDDFHPLKVIENRLFVGSKNIVGEVPRDPDVATLSGAAVDQGGTPNVVRIPSADHGLDVGDKITIEGTTNYNGQFAVVAVPDADNFDIESAYVAEVFAGTETATVTMDAALTLESKFTIQTLGKLIDHLIIGTITEGTSAGSFSGFSHVFNWDLFSIDLTSDVTLDEFGINAMMDFRGAMLIQAGKQGNWYTYNGQSAQNFRRFPGDWSNQNEGVTEANAISSWKGIPVFGFSNESGNPTLQGVYSLGGFDAKYPIVFNYDFPSVLGGSDDTEIGVIARIGEDMVFGRTSSTNHNVMRVDTSNKYNGANLETQVINAAREKLKNFVVTINYRDIPSNTAITLGQKTNDASGYSAVTLKQWSKQKYLRSDAQNINAANIQFKISTTSDGNNAPEIESVIIDFNIES